jgi:thymidylate synthase ThyX/DNA-binding CsgD family transcriptional regulator
VAGTTEVIPENTIRVLDHGFVRLDASMASDLSVVNGARVSFARRKEVMDESDEGLVRFLMRDRHGTPFEHNSFRFHIRCPIFVAREWMRHRVGCLTGDTVVTFVNCEGHTGPHLRKTIDELCAMWSRSERNGHALSSDERREVDRLASGGTSVRSIARQLRLGRRGVASYLRGGNEHRDGRWRVRRMRLRVLNESTNEFEIGHVSDIVDKGVQPVYRLTLADGRELTLTENHRLFTREGWMIMRDAVGLVGDGPQVVMTRECALMTNGVAAYKDRDWLKARREAGKSVREIAEEAGCSYHTIRKWLARLDLRFTPEERSRGRTPWNKGLHGYRTGMVLGESHREAIRRARSGLCPTSHSSVHRTHGAELASSERFAANLETAAPLEELPVRKGWKLTPHAVAVASIEYVGLKQTYDLCVEGPWHNFVANGVVVHNSFNEFSMRYAKATDDFYVPEPEDVRTQVGKPGAYSFDPVDPDVAEQTREELRAVYDAAFAAYERLVDLGVARELARCVMPVGAYTEFYWTINARSLMNFVSLRAAETAQREIRRYADAVEQFFAERMPVTHAAFVANSRMAP